VEPNENVPFLAIAIVCPELVVKVAPASDPLATVKDRSLSAWATSFGLASRSVSWITRLCALAVKVAEASAAPPDVVAPEGVTNVIEPA
jgi:hypothetical protein